MIHLSFVVHMRFPIEINSNNQRILYQSFQIRYDTKCTENMVKFTRKHGLLHCFADIYVLRTSSLLDFIGINKFVNILIPSSTNVIVYVKVTKYFSWLTSTIVFYGQNPGSIEENRRAEMVNVHKNQHLTLYKGKEFGNSFIMNHKCWSTVTRKLFFHTFL